MNLKINKQLSTIIIFFCAICMIFLINNKFTPTNNENNINLNFCLRKEKIKLIDEIKVFKKSIHEQYTYFIKIIDNKMIKILNKKKINYKKKTITQINNLFNFNIFNFKKEISDDLCKYDNLIKQISLINNQNEFDHLLNIFIKSQKNTKQKLNDLQNVVTEKLNNEEILEKINIFKAKNNY